MINRLTRRNIHFGLSAREGMLRWQDVLNFRFSNYKTFAVHRRRRLFTCDAGFHTILHGFENVTYALGSKQSFVFQNSDDCEFKKLWRLKLVDKSLGKHVSEAPRFRGNYEGDASTLLKITCVDGELIPDFAWPEEVVEEPLVDPDLHADCGLGEKAAWFIQVQNSISHNIVVNATVSVYKGNTLIAQTLTSGNGIARFDIPVHLYTVVVKKANYKTTTIDIDLIDNEQSDTIQLVPFFEALIGLVVSVRYSNTEGPIEARGGHQCNSAIYKLKANNYVLGWANLNNLEDGGDRRTDFVFTDDIASAVYLNQPEVNYIVFNLLCDPTQSGFDLFAYNGTCHPNIQWVVVTDRNGTELYNGIPTDDFLNIQL